MFIVTASNFTYSLSCFQLSETFRHLYILLFMPHFRRICMLDLCDEFALHFGEKTRIYTYLLFAAFTFRPTPLLASIKVFVLYGLYVISQST
jgi:hypothetical protein